MVLDLPVPAVPVKNNRSARSLDIAAPAPGSGFLCSSCRMTISYANLCIGSNSSRSTTSTKPRTVESRQPSHNFSKRLNIPRGTKLLASQEYPSGLTLPPCMVPPALAPAPPTKQSAAATAGGAALKRSSGDRLPHLSPTSSPASGPSSATGSASVCQVFFSTCSPGSSLSSESPTPPSLASSASPSSLQSSPPASSFSAACIRNCSCRDCRFINLARMRRLAANSTSRLHIL